MWIPQLSTCICVSSVTGIPFSARFESSEMMNFHKHTADGDESPMARQAWPFSGKLQNGFWIFT